MSNIYHTVLIISARLINFNYFSRQSSQHQGNRDKFISLDNVLAETNQDGQCRRNAIYAIESFAECFAKCNTADTAECIEANGTFNPRAKPTWSLF